MSGVIAEKTSKGIAICIRSSEKWEGDLASKEIKQGKAVLRWQPHKDQGFAGTVISDGRQTPIIHDSDEQRLVARLRNEAGMLHPHYVGFDGAIKRFLHFMPGGMKDPVGDQEERGYKMRAAAALQAALTSDAAKKATNEDAIRVAQAPCWTNLLSPFEAMRLKDTLKGPNGGAFLRAAADFAAGSYDKGGAAMTKAVEKHGRISWPIATYLPYFWDFDRHMFLKPNVTFDFAERVGHQFQYDYEPAINSVTYESLLDLVQKTRVATQSLGPRDNIDIQTFIWVVGEYRDEEASEQDDGSGSRR